VPSPALRRFLFIHVMKTAGTTFVQSLRRQFPGAEMYPSRGFDWFTPTDYEAYLSIARLLDVSADRAERIRMYTGHFPYFVRDLIDPALFTITLLRDPVERTISVLKQFKRLEERCRGLTLDEIYEDEDLRRFYIEDHQTKVFALGPHDEARTIMRPITIDDARFDIAKQNLAAVDVIGLTERYDEFVEGLRRSLGWWPAGVGNDDRANASTEDWSVEPALRRRIADDSRYDLELYAYAQELIAKR
jgi:hypothetical protein